MYLRVRNLNMSIERAIYEPAVKDENGLELKPVVRSTQYLGSISIRCPYGAVPDVILERLTDDEKSELKVALIKNEPNPQFWLDSIGRYLELAAGEMKLLSVPGMDASSKIRFELQVKQASKAWEKFFRTAQECGLKRKPNRAPVRAETTAGVAP